MQVALLVALMASAAPSVPTSQQAAALPDSSQPRQSRPLFAFRAGFWNNLHHFLYVLGRSRTSTPDARRAAVANAPAEMERLSNRPAQERNTWDAAIAFYAAGPSKKDAVFDRELVRTTRVLAAAPDGADPARLEIEPALAEVLTRAAPLYRELWWPQHARANAARIADLEPLVAQHGDAAIKRLTGLYGTNWPAEPRLIDISAYANWAGAYSTDGGLIVVASNDEAGSGLPGFETLLHEASHQWDAEIERRLTSLADGRRVPNGLSHALIFYTSGEIVRELVRDYVPYATANGIWNRGPNPALKVLLDRHWLPYLHGKGTFDEAIAALIAEAAGTGR